MTSKELLYVEDALGHESFMKSASCETSKQLPNFISKKAKSKQTYK